ncbi:retention module-containing protein [Porticoccus sp.]|uniref:retention module-containing protein n=1 Tax=Porticoccus sp. TaxID=2024853 RepID=UPI003F69C194
MNEQTSQGSTIESSQDQQILGFVASTEGATVVVVSSDGSLRELKIGDPIHEGDVLQVTDGSHITISFADGSVRQLNSGDSFVVGLDSYQQLAVIESGEEENPEFQDLLAALAAGDDITESQEATAAGAEGGTSATGDEIGQGLQFSLLGGEVTPTAGIDPDYVPPPLPDPTANTDIQESVAAPVVSVSVEVEVDVEQPPNGGEPPTVPNPDFPVIVSGNTANLLEGTNSEEGREVTFRLQLSEPFDQDVDVTYQLVPGTAEHPTDWFDGELTNTVTIPAGETSFPVTVTIVQDHLDEGGEGSFESFQIQILSATNATVNPDASSATVNIYDDDTTPVANDDENAVQEDINISTEGNVITGESSGDVADTDEDGDSLVVVGVNGSDANVGNTIDGTYGTLTLNSDGSYTYELNNNLTEVQGLSEGDTLEDAFAYTVSDTYNAEQNATLTITINGTDDGVTITGLNGEGAEEFVYENDLPDGSSPDDAALTKTGSFDIEAKDGIQAVQVGGELLSLSDLQNLNGSNIVVDTAYGALTLTDYSGDNQGGTINYSYTLDTTVDNDSQEGASDTNFIETIGVTVTDEDGSSDTASLDIAIADDEPTLSITGGDASVTEGGSITNGTWSSDDGADTAGVTKVLFDSTEYDLGTAIDTGKGTLTVNSNGTWTFAAADDLDNDSAQSVDFSVQITDADGDVDSDNHSISITDGTGPSVTGTADMTVDEDDLVDGTDQTKESLSDADTLTFTAGSDAIDSIVFGATDALTINGLNAGDSITWTPSDGGRTLTGSIDGTDVLQLALSGATSVAAGDNDNVTVTATLLDAFPHEDAPDADSLSIDGIKIVASDDDGDSTTATAKVTVVDDEPVSISPEVAYVINSGSDSAVMVPLDVDSNVDDNYGADQGGTVTFANIAVNGTDSGQTVGGQPVYLYTNGTTLIASTLVGSDFATVSADASTQVFEVELNSDGDLGTSSDSYSVTMYQQIDGAVASFDTSNGDYAFEGGNTNYAYYLDQTGVNPSILLTPTEGGTRINGNANEAGVSGGGGGQDVGSNETIRISYIDTVSGTPTATDYEEPADHVIGDNVSVNGGFATLVSSGNTDSDLIIRAYDDTDDDNHVSDVTQDKIIKVVVGGTVFTADGTIDGYTVTFDTDGLGAVQVEGVPDGTQVQVFTADGFTTMEFEYLSGNSFSLGGFGATVPVPGEQINVNLDLAVKDADGDTVIVEDGINLSISPDDHTLVQGDSANNVLSTTADQAATIVGYEGDDILSGNDLNDILVGGKGNDTLSGGGESDLFVWNAGDAGVGATDTITDFNQSSGSYDVSEGDVIDLSELLVGLDTSGMTLAEALDDYLAITSDGTDTTIDVDVDGAEAGTVIQTITLQGVDLTNGGAFSSAEVIESLVSTNSLVAEQ